MYKSVTARRFTDTIDEYGQVKKDDYTDRIIDMYISNRSTSNVDNPMYVNAEYLGLTKDNEVAAGDHIISGSNEYNVLFVIPTHRNNQVFMK